MFLSETEALNLIEQEFLKAGIKLRRDVEISGFTRTVPDRQSQESGAQPWLYPAKKVQQSWTFDFASEDVSIAVEFLTTQDEDRESFAKGRFECSAIGYDLSDLAQRFRDDFSTRTNGTPVTLGLFFDPLARATIWDREKRTSVPRSGSSFESFPEEERKSLMFGDWEKRNELLHHDALELLREQVRYFLDWARKEGKIP